MIRDLRLHTPQGASQVGFGPVAGLLQIAPSICQFTGYNVPAVYTQYAPPIYAQYVPAVYTQYVPANCA
jgi:hypothetical protein